MKLPYQCMEVVCPKCAEREPGTGACGGSECRDGLVLTVQGKAYQEFLERCIERYREANPVAIGGG